LTFKYVFILILRMRRALLKILLTQLQEELSILFILKEQVEVMRQILLKFVEKKMFFQVVLIQQDLIQGTH